jgi:hypothetical protein
VIVWPLKVATVRTVRVVDDLLGIGGY